MSGILSGLGAGATRSQAFNCSLAHPISDATRRRIERYFYNLSVLHLSTTVISAQYDDDKVKYRFGL